MRRWTRRLVRIVVGVYLLLCTIVYFAQDWLAFPGATQQGTEQTRIQYGGSAEVLHLTTSDGTPIAAVFGLAKKPDGSPYTPADHRPTILYFYGNAGAIAWSQGEFDHFRAIGCNVLIPDLAGFGQSGGKASEKSFYATADAAWDYLQHRLDIDPQRIITVGWSMGAAVAVDLAARKPVIGLATFNGFTSIREMAHKMLPFFPTILCKYRFENERKIAEAHCPIFICNGRRDTLVPPEMSDRLAARAGGPVTRLVLDRADHNTVFSEEPEVLWPAMKAFVDKVAPTSGQ
jgi:fermentation-respiration switch protein FrsA (DUF1100 family)